MKIGSLHKTKYFERFINNKKRLVRGQKSGQHVQKYPHIGINTGLYYINSCPVFCPLFG